MLRPQPNRHARGGRARGAPRAARPSSARTQAASARRQTARALARWSKQFARLLHSRYAQYRSANHERNADLDRRIAGEQLAIDLRPVPALEIREVQALPVHANVRVLARHVAIERYAGLRHRIVAADRDFAFKGPAFSIERSTEDLEQVHGGEPFSGAAARLLVA